MTDTPDAPDLPVFPTAAPAVFCDPDATQAMFVAVLDRLAPLVEVDDADLGRPTPCAAYDVAALRHHVFGWLHFFAAALLDPSARLPRPDPETFVVAIGAASDVVRQCSADIQRAIAENAAGQMITMSSSRMAGDAVLAMALGEYIVHGWDLATALERSYEAPPDAVVPAHEFLQGMVAPEYRGPDSGFFDAEVTVAEGSSELAQLLGFAGRNPTWTPSSHS